MNKDYLIMEVERRLRALNGAAMAIKSSRTNGVTPSSILITEQALALEDLASATRLLQEASND
jgi:hypothetical protein